MAGGSPLVLLAAGGTGGHLFPAEALAEALGKRGVIVDLATDDRAERYGKKFPARQIHVIASETVRGRNPIALARSAALIGIGSIQALRLIGRLEPAIVVGFGGYPTVPPVLAATLRKVPALIHEQNAVMGRANRFLASRVDAIAVSFAGVLERAGGALRLRQEDFSPDRLAAEISTLASAPQKLVAMAQAARSEGAIDAAERLADLVIGIIGRDPR
jgi:UDP-N-acetylglucosamine--N-acetylmuramyl-(pentapeptide) pyrophosphoryl-undecaprenol N-acetylglucosamine transferase